MPLAPWRLFPYPAGNLVRWPLCVLLGFAEYLCRLFLQRRKEHRREFAATCRLDLSGNMALCPAVSVCLPNADGTACPPDGQRAGMKPAPSLPPWPVANG